MSPAVGFAEADGFAWEFPRGDHLAPHGFDGRVAAGTPRSGCAATRTIQAMRRMMRAAA